MSEQLRPRLYYLDNLRTFIVILVVVFHVAMNFMKFCPSWWAVIDSRQSMFFTGMVVLVDVPIMPIMFFIAGYFALSSLAAKGQAVFWQDKLLRIVLPWVVGIFTVAPLFPYFWLVARGQDPGLANFLLHMFLHKPFYTQGALWFLGILTVFYLVLSATYRLRPAIGERSPQPGSPSAAFLAAFLIIPYGVFLSIHQFVPDFLWVNLGVIVFQPTRLSLEAFYFALGVYAWRRRWFDAGGYEPQVHFWLPLAVITGFVFVPYKFSISAVIAHSLLARAVHDILHCVFCLSLMLALLGLFRRYLNQTGPLRSRLAESSYAIYWVHQPLVFFWGLVLINQEMNVYLKYLEVSALAVVFSFLIGHYCLGWLPMFAPRARGARLSSAQAA